MNSPANDISIECAAAYLETAFRALDTGEIGVARAALRRIAQHLLLLNGECDE